MVKRPRDLQTITGIWQRNVVLADFLVAAFVAAAGVLALIIEDAIPLEGKPSLDLRRGVALIGTIQNRPVVYRTTGTLFYVRMPSFGRWDWHADAVELARRHRLSTRL